MLAQDAGLEEYGGPKPLSEPQTRIMKALATAAQPRAFVNLHSGEYAMYVPWDSQSTQAAGLPVTPLPLFMNHPCSHARQKAAQALRAGRSPA